MTYLSRATSGRPFAISPWLFVIPPLATLVNVVSDSFSRLYLSASLELFALADSLTHSVVGVLLTTVVFVHRRPFRTLLITSWLCSALIDVDHFISAGSVSLYAATSIHGHGRPFLHDTVTVAALCVIVIVICELAYLWRRNSRQVNSWGEAFLPNSSDSTSSRAENALRARFYTPYVITLCVSLLAHHTRDALRRGFWFRPLNTRAISYPEMTLIFYGLVFVGKFFADATTNIPRRSVFTV
ncbi:transmembrane protein 267-like [Varroa jacobsoni]|uniref:Transmembrane protein 267 n=1 Tax=Varroa destructor TaxID=109461 RepID=A0A7M7J4L2_VARDE|nr:transmembrane protein 267-like [Varroa destructor]XP_022696573.1 transmembrane protein 267-like [Varroa jacobsoni]